ncbi:MAG TPA: M1 family peptidase, partial [Geobacteraceae bacterium]
MKAATFFPCVLLLLLPLVAQAAGPVVGAHDLTITLDPARHRLSGVSVLTLNAGDGERLSLRLARRATVEAVTCDGAPASPAFGAGHLEIPLPHPSHGGTRRVEIRYSCLFDEPLPQRFLNSEEPSYGISGIISPEGTFLGTDADWYPRPAIPAERFTITVDAPAGTEAVTAGKRLKRGTAGPRSRSVWEIRQPLGSVSLAAGNYRVRERSADGIPVYTYFTAQNDSLAERYLAATVKYLRAYRKL